MADDEAKIMREDVDPYRDMRDIIKHIECKQHGKDMISKIKEGLIEHDRLKQLMGMTMVDKARKVLKVNKKALGLKEVIEAD